MSTLVIDSPSGPRQIIAAERSPRTIILFCLMLGGLLLSIYCITGADPAARPAIWFYSAVGLVVCGLGTLAFAWLLIRPGTIRVELDHNGIVERGLLRSRKYSWQQIGPFAPVEETVRSRWLPRPLTNWHAGAFHTRTLSKLGEVRAPEDDELHAADVSLKASLLEHGPPLKATRRFCDILNEWRSEALQEEPLPEEEIAAGDPKPGVVRRRVRFARLAIVLKILLVAAFLVAGPFIVAHWSDIMTHPWLDTPWVMAARDMLHL